MYMSYLTDKQNENICNAWHPFNLFNLFQSTRWSLLLVLQNQVAMGLELYLR